MTEWRILNLKKAIHQNKKKLRLYSFIQFPLVWMVLGAFVIILADGQLSSLVGGSKGFESISLAIVESAVAVVFVFAYNEILGSSEGVGALT